MQLRSHEKANRNSNVFNCLIWRSNTTVFRSNSKPTETNGAFRKHNTIVKKNTNTYWEELHQFKLTRRVIIKQIDSPDPARKFSKSILVYVGISIITRKYGHIIIWQCDRELCYETKVDRCVCVLPPFHDRRSVGKYWCVPKIWPYMPVSDWKINANQNRLWQPSCCMPGLQMWFILSFLFSLL